MPQSPSPDWSVRPAGNIRGGVTSEGSIQLGPVPLVAPVGVTNVLVGTAVLSFFFFFLTKEYIHAIPHRQPWLHGAYLQSIDTPTTLMKLFLLAYRPQVMT